ncbi:MAG TPA: tetratricopeptide repeat protein [Myxococcota bacterium]|nr:tetratricopeptide repeat protein [Myxococcota bacterium]
MADAAKKAKILQSAQKLVQKGQYDKAIKELQVLVKEDPKDVRVWLKIGDLHAKRGAAEDAIQTYLKVAEFYGEQGFHLKAIAVYRQILSIDPARLEFNLKLADIYSHLALVREAFDQYELVANAHLRAGRSAEAIAVLQRMVEVDAENIPNRIKLAEMLSRDSRKDDAADEFGQAAARLEAAGRVDDFIKVAERLVYHRPEDTVTLKRLAYLYIERRDPKRALAKLQQAFKVAPNDAETLGFLAQAFRAIGQIPKTIQVLKELCGLLDRDARRSDRDEVWRQILELDPRDADARGALARSGAGAGDSVPGGAAASRPASALGVQSRGASGGRAPEFEIEEDELDEREADGGGAAGEPAPLLGRDREQSSPELVLDDDLVEEMDEVVDDDDDGVAATGSASARTKVEEEEISWPVRTRPEAARAAAPAGGAAAALFGRGAAAAPSPSAGSGAGSGAGGPTTQRPVPAAQVARAVAERGAASAAVGAAGAGAGAARASTLPGGPAEGAGMDVSRLLQETDIYIKYGLHAKAMEHVQRVFSVDPDNVTALQKLGDLHIGNGSYEDAVKVLLRLAAAHHGRGERDAAVAALSRAVEVKPDDREAQARLRALGGGEAAKAGGSVAGGAAAAAAAGAGIAHGPDEDTPIEDIAEQEDEDERTPVGAVSFDDEEGGLPPEAFLDSGSEVRDLDPAPGPGLYARAPRGGTGRDPLGYDHNDLDGGRTLLEDADFPELSFGKDNPLGRTQVGTFGDIPIGDDALDDTSHDTSRSGARRRPRGVGELDADHGSGPMLGAGLVPSVPSGSRAPRAGKSGATSVSGAVQLGVAAEAEIVDALEEADFFVAQGLLDEARAIVDDVRSRYPTDRRVLAKQVELAGLIVDRPDLRAGGGAGAVAGAGAAAAADPAGAQSVGGPGKGDITAPVPIDGSGGDATGVTAAGARGGADVSAEVDGTIEFAQRLAEDVAEELSGFQPATSGAAALAADDQVYKAFKQTGGKQVEGDPATRFDLAIAYKEMGLIDAAVEEFHVVLDAGYKNVDCWQLIGLCMAEKGEVAQAVGAFKSGLAVEGINSQEQIGLYYELGATYDTQGDVREALYYFESVERKDPTFRGVRSRAAALRARLAGGGGAPPATGGASRTESGASPLPVSGGGAAADDDEEQEHKMAASRDGRGGGDYYDS